VDVWNRVSQLESPGVALGAVARLTATFVATSLLQVYKAIQTGATISLDLFSARMTYLVFPIPIVLEEKTRL